MLGLEKGAGDVKMNEACFPALEGSQVGGEANC